MKRPLPRVIVIGGGIVGVAGAWQLARRGCSVLLLERRESVALETSFANGGQISPSEVAPWSKPEVVRRAPIWMLRAGAPFRWRPSANMAQWRWLWGFLSQCSHAANERSARRLFPLAQASVSELRKARETAKREGWALDYDMAQRGILRIFRTPKIREREWRAEAPLREMGVEMRLLSTGECIEMEPALQHAPENLRGGGLYTPGDESGDAHLFARALWKNAQAWGVEGRFGVEVTALRADSDGRVQPRVNGEWLECDALVLSAGCWSPALARGLGLSLPVWPVKGYSLTAAIADQSRAPRISVTDTGRRAVFTRLGACMRVAGLAEVARSTTEGLDPARAGILASYAEDLFPGAMDPGTAHFWHGYRPMMPDSTPLIGKAPGKENLWLNLGHGSLGWTMSMGSALLLAQRICGETPSLDPRPYDPEARLSRNAAMLDA